MVQQVCLDHLVLVGWALVKVVLALALVVLVLVELDCKDSVILCNPDIRQGSN